MSKAIPFEMAFLITFNSLNIIETKNLFPK